MQAFLRALFVLLFLMSLASGQTGVPERHFTFHYAFTVHNTQPGKPSAGLDSYCTFRPIPNRKNNFGKRRSAVPKDS